MTDNNARERAESLFDREKRREAEIADALTQEQARHDAVIRNMHRLRALRLSRQRKNRALTPRTDACHLMASVDLDGRHTI